MPPLSVVMPVRNALPFLDDSIGSILAQSFAEFEFVILDDASDDGSSERLREWAGRDQRIRLIRIDRPLGPVGSSRMCAEAARAGLVARMDGDDVAHPDRLRRQMEVFEAHPEAGLVGTLHRIIDEQGRELRRLELSPLTRRLPVVPITHCSIMYRRDIWIAMGGYRTGHDFWEDIDLYLRMAQAAPIFIVPDALMAVRFSHSSARAKADPKALERAYDKMHRRLHDDKIEHYTKRRTRPEAFLTLATPLLWAGIRPRIFSSLIKRGRLRPDWATARALVWAAWADVSPRSLRSALNAAAERRECRADRSLSAARFVRWRPMEPCAPQLERSP